MATFVALVYIVVPTQARAGFLSIFNDFFDKPKEVKAEERSVNTQTIGLLQAAISPELNGAKGGGDITVIGGTALMSENGPVGTALDAEETIESTNISLYVVRRGDTLSGIAKMFGVTKNTIVWANDIKNGVITPDQTLIILPVSGVRHTIAKGDTLKSIAKKYKADEEETAQFNNIEVSSELAVGDILIVPDGEIAPPKVVAKAPTTKAGTTNRWKSSASGPLYEGYYMRPLIGGIKTQGLHGYNGVDIASFYGAPIFAAAEGDVIISRMSGWNAGYGNYVVVKHDNGTQTLYAHLSKTLVSVGDHVTRGQQVGEMGNSGKATGTHLHFEIRGATNPF